MTLREFQRGTRSFAREDDLTFHRSDQNRGDDYNRPSLAPSLSAATDLRNVPRIALGGSFSRRRLLSVALSKSRDRLSASLRHQRQMHAFLRSVTCFLDGHPTPDRPHRNVTPRRYLRMAKLSATAQFIHTVIGGATLRRYSAGAIPVAFRNAVANALRLLKPTARPISVIEPARFASSNLACSTRRLVWYR